ncbi:MAG: methylated-DNA--[protein]-cysteine S-methyltransferase [Bdellovibrionales bacterium]|nr:methylated-DNA--[protein]-cysteine S-methyltransferase [Bdellovibrionales bacterium]
MMTPIGPLLITASDRGLQKVEFISGREFAKEEKSITLQKKKARYLKKAKKQLDEYFLGKRKSFRLPLDLMGTDFQLKAWKALQTIPYGQTVSYGEQAQRMHKKGAQRAVGGANNKNPISIIVPCHRVIGKSGDLVGYGGGLKVKKWLLEHEQALQN